jgi:hypothetical protein
MKTLKAHQFLIDSLTDKLRKTTRNQKAALDKLTAAYEAMWADYPETR